MYYDFHKRAKLTALGMYLVDELNKIMVSKIGSIINGKNRLKVLEIGHGRGLFADLLHARFRDKIDYYSVEPNAALCNAGIKKGYKIRNTKVPPFPKDPEWNDFDCIYIAHVLEHFPDYTTVLELLNQFNAKLKSNGYLFILFPDYTDWREDFYNIDYSHGYVMTERRIRQLLLDSNFAVTELRGYRACFTFPMTMLIYPLHLLTRLIAGALYGVFKNMDIFYKIKITLMRNILVIGQKKAAEQ